MIYLEHSEGGPQTARRRPGRSAQRDVGRSGAAGVANGVKRSERIRGQRPLKAEKQESQPVRLTFCFVDQTLRISNLAFIEGLLQIQFFLIAHDMNP